MESDRRANGPTLRDYLRVVGRRKWIILFCALLGPATAIGLSLQQEKLYQASADVLLSRQNLAAALTNTDDPLATQDAERLAETQVNVARVPRVAARALDAANVSDRTAVELLENSSVSAKPSADILVFTVTDPSPRLATRLANEYASQFTLYRRVLDTASLKRARSEVQEQISALEERDESESLLYANLVEKEQELGTLEALQTSNAHLLRPAGEARQIQPRPLRNGLTGLALGLLLGIGLALLRDALDTRVRSAEEVAERLDLPLLGRIAEPPRRFRKAGLMMREKPASSFAESFRVLRTNIEFVNLERGARTIMVTSGVEAEGKSTTAANLAFAFARSGKRVVLVDLDLRRPSLARFVGSNGGSGIADVATGRTRLDRAMLSVGLVAAAGPEPDLGSNGHALVLGSLDALLAGSLPPNPGEFVGTQRMSDLLKDLRSLYDLVVIDSPPLLNVGDARALAAHVDALLLVVRLNVARKQSLTEIRRALETMPAAPLGFVLAGAELEEGYGYDSYAYYGSQHNGVPVVPMPVARQPSEPRDM